MSNLRFGFHLAAWTVLRNVKMQQGLGLLSCSFAERGLCPLCTVYLVFLFTKPRGTVCPRVPYYDHPGVLCVYGEEGKQILNFLICGTEGNGAKRSGQRPYSQQQRPF